MKQVKRPVNLPEDESRNAVISPARASSIAFRVRAPASPSRSSSSALVARLRVPAFFRPGLTSDAGTLLLGAAERAIDLVDRFADCLITAVTDRWMRRDRRMGELIIRQWLLRPRVRTHLRDDQTADPRLFPSWLFGDYLVGDHSGLQGRLQEDLKAANKT